jgi:nucleoside-diphosphate-sugar epimerase
MQVVLGCNGPLGSELLRQLAADGIPSRELRGVCRSGAAPAAPAGVELMAADVADRTAAHRAVEGARIVYCCIGVDYTRFRQLWPPIIQGILWAVQRAKARLVFADNLYCYGPQTVALREDLPLTEYGNKPRLRAQLVRYLLDAHSTGRCPVAIVRASDFYGPRVTASHLGERVFPAALRGESAFAPGNPRMPHCFTYLPDFARALRLVAAAEDAYGSAWHVPNSPALSMHELLAQVYKRTQHPLHYQTAAVWQLQLLGVINPIVRELVEMSFQWDRPYEVDHSRFATRFGEHYTPLADGLETALEWYVRRAMYSS